MLVTLAIDIASSGDLLSTRKRRRPHPNASAADEIGLNPKALGTHPLLPDGTWERTGSCPRREGQPVQDFGFGTRTLKMGKSRLMMPTYTPTDRRLIQLITSFPLG